MYSLIYFDHKFTSLFCIWSIHILLSRLFLYFRGLGNNVLPNEQEKFQMLYPTTAEDESAESSIKLKLSCELILLLYLSSFSLFQVAILFLFLMHID